MTNKQVAAPNSKPWYTSKTLWTNVVLFLIACLGLFAAHPIFVAYAAELLLASAVLNLVLRFFFTETKLD
jgi:NADH:ubiquinone oxidoreductase subunit K